MTDVIKIMKHLLPSWLFRYLQILFYSFKNELLYLETHLTDHCNLNCRSCRHFSSISKEKFRELESFERDMKQMAIIFSNIRVIRLMGGEPLLHPRVAEFMTVTRNAFPRGEIHLVTNGMLLGCMRDEFWRACCSTRTIIDVTLYPIAIDLVRIRELSVKHGVELIVSPLASSFHKYHMNRNGNSDSRETFNACREEAYCPFLDSDNGRLYICAVAASADIYSGYFHENIQRSENDSISIYGQVTPRQILRFLNSPAPFCRYCTTRKTLFQWTRSSFAQEEWFD